MRYTIKKIPQSQQNKYISVILTPFYYGGASGKNLKKSIILTFFSTLNDRKMPSKCAETLDIMALGLESWKKSSAP